MIQRIQTLYLLIAAILMAVTAFSPILQLEGDNILFSYGIMEAENLVKPTWGIVTMAGLSALLSFVAIFLFKNRKKQKNITLVSTLVVVIYYVTALVYLASYLENIFSVISAVAYGILLPVVAIIFLLLALRGINKDEKLVKSLNRIR